MVRKQVTIFTDGACLGNPGPGGYGVILVFGSRRKELSGGFRLTTNNRMEIRGVIEGLAALKEPCTVDVHSDSEYVVNTISRGWAKRWRAQGWRRADKRPASNADLWERLLDLADTHDVALHWVRGHSGHPENERCDALASEAARRPHLPVDLGYERQASLIDSLGEGQ